MDASEPTAGTAARSTPPSPHERAVLTALLANPGRVVGRVELSRLAGLDDDGSRRVDSVLVRIRRDLGPTSVITVRRRGWRLDPGVIAAARQLLARRAEP